MENASKALIIAGAILLSILIISLGIMVFNNARESVAGANLDKYQIQEFNQQFTAYEGNNVQGSRVNTLIDAVYQSDLAEAKDKTGKYVTIHFKSVSPSDATKQYITFGVEDGKVRFHEQPTACSSVEGITSVTSSDPETASGTLKVQPGLMYTVTTHKNNTSGLIDAILIK